METAILVGLGILTLALVVLLSRARREEDGKSATEPSAETKHSPSVACCGAHEVCEAETLLTLTDKIVYYDDEELDAYAGRSSTDYTAAEVDEFREVLLTLQPHEVSGWLRSLGLRKVTPPDSIREEALMIVSEFRDARIMAYEKAQR